jgi:hypothetical protein
VQIQLSPAPGTHHIGVGIGDGGSGRIQAGGGSGGVSLSDPFGLCVPMPGCMFGFGLLREAWDYAQQKVSETIQHFRENTVMYARGTVGVTGGRAEVDLAGRTAVRGQPQEGTEAIGGAVGWSTI